MAFFYPDAERRYQGRLNKRLGRSIAAHCWMKLDEARGCFIVSRVVNKHTLQTVEHTDASGRIYQTVLQVTQPHEQWQMAPIAEIWPDRVEIYADAPEAKIRTIFGLYSTKPISNKLAGRLWHLSTYYDANQQRVQVEPQTGTLPITLYPDRMVVSGSNRVRTFNKPAQKELNMLILRVRRIFGVRAKLGILQQVDRETVADYIKVHVGINPYVLHRDAELFLKVLRAVREDDLTTLYPILWLVLTYGGRGWKRRGLLEAFNSYINTRREELRQLTGVVEYVPTDDA